MSIISFGREAGFPKTKVSLNSDRIVQSHIDRFKIEVDNEGDYGITILQQLPASLQVGFDYGFGMKVREQNLERDKAARNMHYLDLTIDDQISDEENEDKDKPPDQRRAKWSWDFETLEHAFTVDLDGNPIQTKAGDPIEVETDFIIPVLTIEKNQLSFDPDTIINYVNHTNQGTFWGAPPKAALLAGIRDNDGEVFAGVRFRKVTYIIKFRLPDVPGVIAGWDLLLVNHGPNKLVAGKKVAIKDDSGSKITANLGSNGQVLNPGDDPLVLQFKQYKQADFDTIKINRNQL